MIAWNYESIYNPSELYAFVTTLSILGDFENFISFKGDFENFITFKSLLDGLGPFVVFILRTLFGIFDILPPFFPASTDTANALNKNETTLIKFIFNKQKRKC